MRVMYSSARRFLIALTIIAILSPLPSVLRNNELSYWSCFIDMVNDVRHIDHLSIPKVDWTDENILFSTQIASAKTAIHTKNNMSSTLSFIWDLYSLSMLRFFFTFLLGLAIGFLIGCLFLRLSKRIQRYLAVLLYRLPDSLTTVVIQCAIILICISITKYVKLPFFSSFIIIVSTCTVLIIQTMTRWLPFLYRRKEQNQNDFSYLISTLCICTLTNRKFLIAYIIISFFYMECTFHVDGLLQFIVQYSVTSPILFAIGLLLLYISYMILTALQTIITTNAHYRHLQSVTEVTNS